MKVLFVSSGNSEFFEIAPFIKSQGESLSDLGIEMDYFTIKGKGFRGYLRNISRLKKYVKTTNPDILHAHYSLTGWVACFAAPDKPRVLSLMGSDTHGGNIRKSFQWIMSLQLFLIQFFFPVIIVKSANLSRVLWARKKIKLILKYI